MTDEILFIFVGGDAQGVTESLPDGVFAYLQEYELNMRIVYK
ncbi:MAG: hypothetical protein RBT65_07780 [Methanolobus sp.]|nr:hypothetical protein [Methanolobus sp.]